MIVGRNPVLEGLRRRASEFEKVYVQRGAGGGVIKEITSAAGRAGVPVQYVPRQRLDQLAPGQSHQGVAAAASQLRYVELEVLVSSLGDSFDDVISARPLLLILDRIQDPHNYGAILRTAAAARVAGVVVPAADMAPLSPAVVKASAGYAGAIPISRVRRLVDAIVQLKECGFWVVGLDSSGGKQVWDTDWQRPVALVVGSEGSGMTASVRDVCDELTYIPMSGEVESLNASVAAAIPMFIAAHARG